MKSTAVFLVSGVLGFAVSGPLGCDGGDCGPSELVDGTYRVFEPDGFGAPPPMEEGELLFERAAERVTITYGPSENPRRVVLRIVSQEELDNWPSGGAAGASAGGAAGGATQ